MILNPTAKIPPKDSLQTSANGILKIMNSRFNEVTGDLLTKKEFKRLSKIYFQLMFIVQSV